MNLVLTCIQKCCGYDTEHHDEYDATSEKVVFEPESLKQKSEDDSKSYDDKCLDKSSEGDFQDSHPLANTTGHRKEEEIKSTKENLMKLVETEFPERVVKKKSKSNGRLIYSIPKITLTGPELDSSTRTLYVEVKKKKTHKKQGKKKVKMGKKQPDLS